MAVGAIGSNSFQDNATPPTIAIECANEVNNALAEMVPHDRRLAVAQTIPSIPHLEREAGIFAARPSYAFVEAVHFDELFAPIDAVRGHEVAARWRRIEDAMERLLFLAKIERGLKQADAGRTFSHQQAKEKLAKWLK